MEIFEAVTTFMGQFVGTAMGVSLLLMLITRFVPNEKLYQWGYNIGATISSWGLIRAGKGWESIEDFLINSFGKLFEGIRDGLDSDDPN